MIHPCIFRVDEAPSAEAIPRVADAGIEKVFTLTRSGTYSRNGGLESASRTEAEDEEGAVAVEHATRHSPDREGGRSSHARRGGTVTDIAMELGFNDLGRFAADYRNLFGFNPSQTLGHDPTAPTERLRA